MDSSRVALLFLYMVMPIIDIRNKNSRVIMKQAANVNENIIDGSDRVTIVDKDCLEYIKNVSSFSMF
jgi:hypothetical protein